VAVAIYGLFSSTIVFFVFLGFLLLWTWGMLAEEIESAHVAFAEAPEREEEERRRKEREVEARRERDQQEKARPSPTNPERLGLIDRYESDLSATYIELVPLLDLWPDNTFTRSAIADACNQARAQVKDSGRFDEGQFEHLKTQMKITAAAGRLWSKYLQFQSVLSLHPRGDEFLPETFKRDIRLICFAGPRQYGEVCSQLERLEKSLEQVAGYYSGVGELKTAEEYEQFFSNADAQAGNQKSQERTEKP